MCIDPRDIDPETGRPYAGYSSPSLDTSFHDHEMDVDGPPAGTLTLPGYELEHTGGGCSLLAKRMDAGAHVWASDDSGAYPPEAEGWIVCAYADDQQELTLYDNSGEGELELRQSALSAELAIYQHQQGLPRECAMEQLHRELTADQRRWLSDFVIRWEALEEAA